MGRHRAPSVPVRELRSSYHGLLETYTRLLREHRRLEAEHREVLDATGYRAPSTEVELWRPMRQTVWGFAHEVMHVETACALVRDFGLLTSAGLE